MCGFVGLIDFKGIQSYSLSQLNDIRDLLVHRGPDHGGHFIDQHIYLGHRRLSVIDLSKEGNQPIISDDGKMVMVFNGEIYNFKELGLKYPEIRSNSDSRTLLYGYRKYGKSFLKEIRGIYSFCIVDFRNEVSCLFLRDPSGVKPFYYHVENDRVAFASEIKGVLPFVRKREPKRRVLLAYLNLGYCIEPETAFMGVQALEPGIIFEFSPGQGCLKKSETLWNFFGSIGKKGNPDDTKDLLMEAVKKNLIADVDTNIALSGGIDSSLIYALSGGSSARIGINVRFNDNSYDESGIAIRYAEHLGQKLEIVYSRSKKGNLELMDELLAHFDQPFADSSAIPFYLMSLEARKHSKVLVGGDGGDELFGGYLGMRGLHYLDNSLVSRGVRLLSLRGSFFKNSYGRKINRLNRVVSKSSLFFKWLEWQSWVSTNQDILKNSEDRILRDRFFEELERKNFKNLETSKMIEGAYFQIRLLSDFLRKADMMSMKCGLEYRVPFLDEDLVSNSFSIPLSSKFNFWRGKLALREIHRDFYPSNLSKLSKKGFSIPLDSWLTDSEFEKIYEEIIRPGGIVLELVTLDYINNLFAQFNSTKSRGEVSREGYYQRILILYSLQMWFNRHFR
jgi:asparagine synthase (glutamine-hydrolysing)